MHIRTLLLAAAAAILPSTPALAEDAPVEEVVVTAARDGEGVRIDLLGASATVVGDESVQARQTRFVSDLLRDVPGVAVNRLAGLTQVRLRGGEANHTLTLIDGIEASDPFFGEFDFGGLLAEEGVKLEVLRGQQSALYGSDAIGGVIHYITLSGAEAPGVRLRAEAGSFETFASTARVAGVAGALDYALSAAQFRTGGTPNVPGGSRDVGSSNWSLAGKARWTASERFHVDLVARYARTRADITNQDFDPTSPTLGLALDSPGDFARNRAFYGLARGELALMDGAWTHALSGQVAASRRNGYDAEALSSGSRGRRLKGSYETSVRFGSDRLQHRVSFAADLERERFRNVDPSGFAFTGYRHIDNLGLVAAYDLVADDRFALGLSFRHDDNDRFENADTYRAQASYRFDTGTRVRAAAGSGVKNPGFGELFGFVDGRYIGNPDLKPEKSEGWEAGVEQTFAEGAVTLGATYFRSVLKDEIFTSFPPPLFIASPANSPAKSRQRGVEAFARARWNAFLLDASYTWLHAREAGLPEVRRPQDVASMALTWFAPDDRGSATLVVRYNGAQQDLAFTDPSFIPVRERLDDYTLVNLNAEWRVTDKVSVFGRVENLLDERYQEVFSFESPGRGAYAGVRAAF